MYEQLDEKTKELLYADLLFTAVTAPSSTASHTNQHGAYTKTYGSQSIRDRENLYDTISHIYKKYGDKKLDAISDTIGSLTWME